MVNSEDFSKRLETIIDYYGESAAAFAEKIGVQRSSISHIISGRNKPSLDFVMKIIYTYPEVELYWLLNGKGTFPSTPKTQAPAPSLFQNTEPKRNEDVKVSSKEKAIERIVIFYTDGSFKSFQN
ncbi:helix-turn-helix domain-containing protein [Mariniflexile ostreae]|uniref:Helix-turn-helix domain-containing protein n=1 Tax=Mariniflexile ostreae TaxID=1520892 RepID=A0ABV5FDR2_9FLAO